MLAGHSEIPIMLVAFDLLAEHGQLLLPLPYRERRRRLETLHLSGPGWTTTVATDDGEMLRWWVRERGLEGVVAKRVAEGSIRKAHCQSLRGVYEARTPREPAGMFV
jgi:ATP-dependent DNA ligase